MQSIASCCNVLFRRVVRVRHGKDEGQSLKNACLDLDLRNFRDDRHGEEVRHHRMKTEKDGSRGRYIGLGSDSSFPEVHFATSNCLAGKERRD
jgi:hypothetical protein